MQNNKYIKLYAAFKAGLVSPDSIVALMNRWEITAKFSHIIANNPNVRDFFFIL